MGDKEVCVLGDFIPNLFQRFSSLKIEGPIMKPRLPWTSVELYSFNNYAFVLQIGSICYP
jgi:hypothetical protein